VVAEAGGETGGGGGVAISSDGRLMEAVAVGPKLS
jgi:hypothetical protein